MLHTRRSLLHIALLAVGFWLSISNAHADLGPPDLPIMQQLAAPVSQGGYGWAAALGWDTNNNPCPTTGLANWPGVTCNKNGRVVIIVATCGTQLINGPLPPILSQLTALTSFDLRGCGLTGTIPDAMGSMTRLTRLRLDPNALTGPIPASFATLPNLGYPVLAGNMLTGSIPDFPSNGSTIINLAGNFLTQIPDSWTLFNRNVSYNCYPTLPASCDSQSTSNVCTPNRQDCPSAVMISKVSGDGQWAQMGAMFPNPLVVSVTDLSSNPVAGVTVTFSGPGIVTTSAMSGNNGLASAPVQANSTIGGNTVTASTGPGTMVTFGLTAGDTSACSSTFSVTTNADSGPRTLRQGLADVCPGGTIDLSPIAGQTIALSASASSYNFGGRLYIGDNVTINGAGATISGSNLTRILFVQDGNVTLSNLTLENGLGEGGTSQDGGSAAGMGGAIFINNANVTLNQVALSSNQALGGSPDSSGNGGGGGFGGNLTGGDLGGSAGTGDGAGGVVQGVGGLGGFGGGGGAATVNTATGGGPYGGIGGFGGGSGAGTSFTPGSFNNQPSIGDNIEGTPGYGGGVGATPAGGGGAGFGGAIFVRAGSLNLNGVTFNGNSAVGGTNAQGKGGSLFVYNGANLNEIPNTITFSNDLAAAAGQPGQGYSGDPYDNSNTCPGVDTVDICGVIPTNTLTVSVSGNGAITDTTGLINCPSGNCAALFSSGATLTANPAAGVAFNGWSGACSGTGSCIVSLAGGSAVVGANFVDVPPTVVSFNVLFGSESYNVIGSARSDLPWQITGIQVVFSKPITSASTSSLSGVTPTAISGVGTNTLTWTISPLTLGNYKAVLAATGPNAVQDAAGNSLAGGSFTQALNVLWADFNGDRSVTSADVVLVNNARAAAYNIFADMNGDGVVNVTDVNIVRSRIGTSLP